MKLHIITIGHPKLAYAKLGWDDYWQRLGHYHQLRATHIPDKNNDASHILESIGKAYFIALEIAGKQLSSQQLADFLEKQAQNGRELAFVIGGPDGLPPEVVDKAALQFSLGRHTMPHDLAMVSLLEALYRSSTINAGHPYHR